MVFAVPKVSQYICIAFGSWIFTKCSMHLACLSALLQNVRIHSYRCKKGNRIFANPLTGIYGGMCDHFVCLCWYNSSVIICYFCLIRNTLEK